MKKFFKNLGNKGNVLSTAIVVMVVLASSVAVITSVAVNTTKQANLQNEFLTDETTAMKLIEQAIGEFEAYISETQDFDAYKRHVVPVVLANYGVTVEDVTSSYTDEGYGEQDSYEAYVFKFSYPLENGNTLQMFSYVSSEGTTNPGGNANEITPFNFSIGTNGDLILSGGYYDNPTEFSENPSYFANNIYLNKRAAYSTYYPNYSYPIPSSWKLTTNNSSTYPAFNGVESIDMYYKENYAFCETTCWEYPSYSNQPIVFNKTISANSPLRPIEEATFDVGNYELNTIVPNFFGTYDFDEELRDFLVNDAPTDDKVMEGQYDLDFTLEEIKDIVRANTGVPELTKVTETTYLLGFIPIQQKKWVYIAPDMPFTSLNDLDGYDIENGDKDIPVSGVYDGDLYLNKGIHLEDRANEAIVVLGDLYLDNSSWTTIDGKYVVLGDLIFQGSVVDIDGAFYVYGETRMQFDVNDGINERDAYEEDQSEYGLTIISKDNIIITSMWAGNNYSGSGFGEFDAFLYTEESIYIDSVYSRVQIAGVLFANALGESGNHIPVVDQDGNYIEGIVINSYRGYINRRGKLRSSSSIYDNRFYYKGIPDQDKQDAFVEIPVFDSVIFKEGDYTFLRSEFSYETKTD